MIGDDTKRQMPFTILAAQRTHFKRLVRYIRLNDYLVMNAKLGLAIDSTRKILDALLFDPTQVKADDKNKSYGKKFPNLPLWTIETKFTLETFDHEFHPDIQAIKDCVEKCLLEGIQIICHNDMLIEDKKFKDYVMVREDAAKEIGENSLFGLVTQDAHYEDLKKEIFKTLDESFEMVDEYAKNTLPE